jgi:cytochrome P450
VLWYGPRIKANALKRCFIRLFVSWMREIRVSDDVADYPFRNLNALDPPPEWARLRQECPVAKVRLASGDEAVLLTRYADVRRALSDPRFSRQLDSEDAARVTANESGGAFGSDHLVSAGEAHQRWRRLVGRYFTVRRMAAMRPGIEAMAESLIDDMRQAGSPADIVTGLGFPLPVWVICDLLGVPREDRGRFSYWSDTLLNMTRYTQAEIDAGQAEFAEYFTNHIAAKRAAPGSDLLSELITVTDADDGRLSRKELLLTGQGLLIAGHETTATVIGKMVAILLADRDRWERLLADPGLVDQAVEEILRYDANPGFGMPRYLSEDFEVAGTVLPRGTTVICSMAAANRDREAFTEPEEVDLARSPNAHLAFGVGQYSCIGQSLARTELRAVLSVLMRTMPTLRLAGPADRLRAREGLIVGGLEEVMVTF